MKHLWQLLKGLKRYRKAALLAPLFILGAVLMDLLLPAIMQRMIDIGVAERNLAYIAKMSGAMLLAALLGMGSGLASNYYAAIASQSLGGDLRAAVFGKIMRLSRGNVDRLETGQLITRATNDINQIQMTTLMGLKIAMRAPLLLTGGLAMAVVTSPGLSFIIALMIPLLLLGLLFLIRYAFPMFAQVQSRIDRINSVIGENLSGIRVIKAFVRGDFERRRFAGVNDDLYETSIKAYRRIALMMPLIMIISNVAIVAALYYGGVDFARDSIRIGQIQAFINYLALIMFSLIMMAMVMMMISRAEASAQRIREVFAQTSEVEDLEDAREAGEIRGRVEFQDVCINSSWVPMAWICPSSSTMILSASRTVEMRWATVKVVRPARYRSKPSWISVSVSTSTALVESSRIRMAGLPMMARAMDRRCFCPPERLTPRAPRSV